MTRRFHHPHQRGLRLSPGRKRAVYAVAALAWASGVAWLIFHYYLMRQGDFGPEPNPLESWWLKLHGACAFAMLWLGGLLWGVHVRPGWNQPRRFRSGVATLAAIGALALSGYLLYYLGDDTARSWTSIVHWSLGLASPLLLLTHVLHGRGDQRGQQRGHEHDLISSE